MDPTRSGDALRILEKQNEIYKEALNLFSHELHKLQVEEEMIMRKFYETTLGLTKKGGATAKAATIQDDDVQSESTSKGQ